MAAYEEQEYNNPFSFRIWMKLFPFFKPYKKGDNHGAGYDFI